MQAHRRDVVVVAKLRATEVLKQQSNLGQNIFQVITFVTAPSSQRIGAKLNLGGSLGICRHKRFLSMNHLLQLLQVAISQRGNLGVVRHCRLSFLEQ